VTARILFDATPSTRAEAELVKRLRLTDRRKIEAALRLYREHVSLRLIALALNIQDRA
jgi:hypothetical protein